MAFKLPPLPYSLSALKPHISEETLSFHYGKHHAGYINKLNVLVQGTNFEKSTLDELLKTTSGAIFNNAAQAWNHEFYWNSMSPNGGGQPVGTIKQKIDEKFGSFDNFKKEYSNLLVGHFGSGWGWVVQKQDGSVDILQTHDAGNPIADGTGKPVLTCDIWEHAYYLDYKNDRASYVNAWWNTINWDFANKQLQ